MAELNARIASCEQTKEQLYHLTGLDAATMDEIFSCKFLKVRFGRLPRTAMWKLFPITRTAFTFRQYDFDGEFTGACILCLPSNAEAVIPFRLAVLRTALCPILCTAPPGRHCQAHQRAAAAFGRARCAFQMADVATGRFGVFVSNDAVAAL